MKNLLINHSIISLIEPPLNIFFKFFCFIAKDLYNDGAIGSDGSICRTLCDLCIRLDGYLVVKTLAYCNYAKRKKNQSTFFYT